MVLTSSKLYYFFQFTHWKCACIVDGMGELLVGLNFMIAIS